MNTSFALSAYQWRGVWGEQTTSTPGRGYCANLGHPEDETGLVYMRARYYEPTTGRFISEDPARDGVNWYLYADGDPVGKVDASGEKSQGDADAFVSIIRYLEDWGLILPQWARSALKLYAKLRVLIQMMDWGAKGTAASVAALKAMELAGVGATIGSVIPLMVIGMALAISIALFVVALAFLIVELYDYGSKGLDGYCGR